jgi:exodeoxyribonuclease VII small subunit
MSASSANIQSVTDLSFEAALAELESIVSQLEHGDIPLEKSIEIYERGAALRRHCEAKLKDAQMKIDRIVLDDSGAARAEPSGLE